MKRLRYILRSFFSMGLGRLWGAARLDARTHGRRAFFVLLDMLWCAVRYGAGQTDYRAMGFGRMPGARRRTFVTRGVNNEYIRRLNRRAEYGKLENKVWFNTLFAAFVGREWLDLGRAGLGEFDEFVQQRLAADAGASLIVKPVDKLCGQGIEKIALGDGVDTAALYGALKANGQLLVEECVVQHPALAALYPPSVNTLRLVTVRGDDGVHFIVRILRTGAGGNVVDNTDVGGLFMFLDEAGTVVTPAVNYKEEMHEAHPDTGAVLVGFCVPFFAEAAAMVCAAAQVVPGLRYVGWDVAITESGPVLIEANHNPAHSGYQKVAFMGADEPGKRPLFEQIIEKIR